MNQQQVFHSLMLSGHGRCFQMIKQYGANVFRDSVMYGCLNNIAFDWQSEGSRGLFLFNLALRYDDPEEFLLPAIEKFSTAVVNDNLCLFCQMTDFISHFAYGKINSEEALKALDSKYKELYSILMQKRHSKYTNDILQSYEYLSMRMMHHFEKEKVSAIIDDMGKYLFKRRRVPHVQLRRSFQWFAVNLLGEFGDDAKEAKFWLDDFDGDKTGIIRFFKVMGNYFDEETTGTVITDKTCTADKYIEKALNRELRPKDKYMFAKFAPEEEKYRLALAALAEKDVSVKIQLLKAFTLAENPWKLSPDQLIIEADSGNIALRDTIPEVLSFVKNPQVHDFAYQLFMNGDKQKAFPILLFNYQPTDKELLLDHLDSLTIDLSDTSGWHHIVHSILDVAETENNALSDEFLLWIYNNSMCSCCREYALDVLESRGSISFEMLMECKMDSNENIREMAKRKLKEKSENGTSDQKHPTI